MYRVVVSRRARTAIEALQEKEAARIESAIDALASNPRPPGCVKLRGEERWRIRVGDYRIIYQIDDNKLLVTVIKVGHRRDVYR